MIKNEIAVWLDLLCWESFLKILFIFRGSPKKVYYCQISKLFLPFKNMLQSLTKISLIQVQDFIFGEERINDSSAYEMVHIRVNALLKKLGDKWLSNKVVNNFTKQNAFNALKITEHLKEAAFYHLYRQIEILVMAEIRSKDMKRYFMLRDTPFSAILKTEFEDNSVFFYRTYFSHHLSIINRKNYNYDRRANIYFSSGTTMLFCLFQDWLIDTIKILLAKIYLFRKTNAIIESENNIGVEQLKSRFRQDEINDLYWIQDSGIEAKSVYHLERQPVFDRISEENFSKLAIKRAKLCPPVRPKKAFILMNKKSNAFFISPSTIYILRILGLALMVVKGALRWNEEGWINLQLAKYKYRVLYWLGIYKQLNIKMLWCMSDVDEDKLIKAQALEILGALNMGSHWSNNPYVSGTDQKCYDVFFVWGEHFTKNIFTDYPYLEAFVVGYPCDYYFIAQAQKARNLRAGYNRNFILSYQDSVMKNDIHYSLAMQIKMHKMLISLLNENANVVLFLKPKRKEAFDEIAKQLPQIENFIREGRIVVFFGETPQTKAVPAWIGMASDLVVGLGISAAAAECYFSGTVAFHADLTGFTENEFANQGLNKIVFRDIEILKQAIQKQIDGRGISYDACREYYKMLDPFQDGKAYLRTGFIIKKLQEAFQSGLSREEAVKWVRKEYDAFLAECFPNIKVPVKDVVI